ncbi:hypothetical protein BGZ52_006296, partial [Haplosporangium bisporale]
PIEKIWAVVKNAVAANMRGKLNTATPKPLLDWYFAVIPSSIFHSVWKTNVEISLAYYDAAIKGRRKVALSTSEEQCMPPEVAEREEEEKGEEVDEPLLEKLVLPNEEAFQQALSVAEVNENENVFVLEAATDSGRADEEGDEEGEEEDYSNSEDVGNDTSAKEAAKAKA